MEGARVVIIEDDEEIRGFIRYYVEREGHIVTEEAGTLDEAFNVIDRVESGDVKCNVLCVDGSLASGAGGVEDGRAVVEDVRHRKLGVKIVGFSANLMKTDFKLDIDAEVVKPHIEGIPRAIAEF